MNHLTDRAGSVASIILNKTAIINDWQKEEEEKDCCFARAVVVCGLFFNRQPRSLT